MVKSKIKQDPRNTRLHDEVNKQQIKNSLEELGAGRSVVIDNEDYIIAGNGVYEQAEKLGIKTRVIETDGTELVVVKRTDLNYDSKERRKLAIADNAVGETSEWNFEELTDEEVNEWDIEVFEDVKILEEPSYDELIDDNKDKPPTMKITFKEVEHLQSAEIEIQELIDRRYKGAFFSVSCGEL